MQCNKLAAQYTEFLGTLYSVSVWVIFMPLLSMNNFFLGEVIHLILYRRDKKKDPQFPN